MLRYIRACMLYVDLYPKGVTDTFGIHLRKNIKIHVSWALPWCHSVDTYQDTCILFAPKASKAPKAPKPAKEVPQEAPQEPSKRASKRGHK